MLLAYPGVLFFCFILSQEDSDQGLGEGTTYNSLQLCLLGRCLCSGHALWSLDPELESLLLLFPCTS